MCVIAYLDLHLDANAYTYIHKSNYDIPLARNCVFIIIQKSEKRNPPFFFKMKYVQKKVFLMAEIAANQNEKVEGRLVSLGIL